MRIVFFALFLISPLIKSYSQNIQDQGYVSLSGGPSVPVGGYGNRNLSNNNAGFASFGDNINLSYSRLLHNRFGIAAELFGSLNPLNVKAMENAFSQQQFNESAIFGSNGQSSPPPPNYVNYPYWEFQKKSWLSFSAFLGGYGEIPLTKKPNITLTAKALAGAVYLISPKLTGAGINDTSLIEINQAKASAFGFAYSLNGGIKYDFSKKFCLLFNIEYIGTTTITFKNVRETILIANGIVIPGLNLVPGNYDSISVATAIGNEKQKISLLNFNLGVAFKL